MNLGRRYIDADKVVALIDRKMPNLSPTIRQPIVSWLARQPKAPRLIGREGAAKLLGVGSPYISVLIRNGQMPKAITVEGGKDVYDEAEVKALAKRRKKAAEGS